MKKKHFELIAGILKTHIGVANNTQAIRMHFSICIEFADRLAQVNPRFQKDKFLIACGVKE